MLNIFIVQPFKFKFEYTNLHINHEISTATAQKD